MKIRTLTEKDVAFNLECIPEDTPIKGNALASGDDKVDREAEEWIEKQLRSGNEWAWCTVKVTARFESWAGDDYLGCCSYESEEDFKKGGYFEDMKLEALADLNARIQKVASSIPLESSHG